MCRRPVLVALVVLGLLVSLRGAAVAQQDRQVLVVGMFSPPKSFNPLATSDDYSLRPIELMWSVLARWNNEQVFEPHLAKSWEVSRDGLTWTFHLQPEANWSDGKPLTANDVKMTWKLLANKDTGALYIGFLRAIKGAEEYYEKKANDIVGLQVVDDKTLKVTLTAPSATLLQDVHYFILPSHILGNVPPAEINDHPFWTNPNVSVGPYIFQEYRTGQFIRLRKNPTYFRGAPKIDEVIIRIGTQDTLLAQLEKGEVDLVIVPPAEAARVQSMKNVTLYRVRAAGVMQLGHINLTRPYLQDKRVRQAMMYALDREGLAKTAYEGFATARSIPAKVPWAQTGKENPYTYDPVKARRLLLEVGWDSRQELTFLVPTGNKPRELMGPIMKQFLEMVGFRVKLEMADFPTVLERVRQGNYDLTIIGWGFHGDPNETSRVYESKNPPPGGWNIMRYQNARVDRLYEQGRSTLDQKRRARIYQELQGILNDEVPTLFLIREDKLFGLSNRVKGAQFRAFRREAVPDDLWNIETWTLGGGN